MNKVIISGNLCADPEKHVTQNGISQVTVRLAVQRKYKDSQTGKRETDFMTVVAWRNNADFIAKYAQKGDKLTVDGVIQTRSYEKDGVRRYSTEIVANDVELDRKRPAGNANSAQETAANEYTETEDSGLPF